MKKPLDPRTKEFREHRERLMKKLVEEIWFGANSACDVGWLGEAVQSVAKIDPDITDDMMREAMRLAINRNRESIARSERWIAESREANGWIERALHGPRTVEVVASPEIAALFTSGLSDLSEVVLKFKPRGTAE